MEKRALGEIMNAHFLLLIIATILWFIAAIIGFFPNTGSRIHIGWLGMFFYGLSLVVK